MAGTGARRGVGGFLLTSALPSAVALGVLAWLAAAVNWSFVASLDFGALYKYRFALFQGLVNTLAITASALLAGLVLGFVLALCLRLARKGLPGAALRWPVLVYIEVLRDTPLVVALFWIHFALPVVTGISTTVWQSGFIALTLQSSAYLADLARAGIQAVPRGQWDAADALGLTASAKWFDVVLPQAVKIIIPPLANIGIGYFKASSVLALLSVGELMTVAQRVSTYSFKPIETLTTVGLVYLVLGYVLSGLTYRLERLFKTAKI